MGYVGRLIYVNKFKHRTNRCNKLSMVCPNIAWSTRRSWLLQLLKTETSQDFWFEHLVHRRTSRAPGEFRVELNYLWKSNSSGELRFSTSGAARNDACSRRCSGRPKLSLKTKIPGGIPVFNTWCNQEWRLLQVLSELCKNFKWTRSLYWSISACQIHQEIP